MDIVQPMCELGKCLCVPLKRQFNYVKKFQENFEKLNQEASYLYAKKADICEVIESDRVSKTPTNECQTWLNEVGTFENKINEIVEEFNEKKKCFGERCPNIRWRMKLGKRIIVMIDDIVKLREKFKFEGGVVVDAPPRPIRPTLAPTIEVKTSTGCTVQEILRCLRDDKIKKIGVWGMGGVGKTTILKHLSKFSEVVQKFKIVIWVTVSKDINVRTVQKKIAEQLSLSLMDNESIDSVAGKLCQKLDTMKFLIVLDDVWDVVDLDVVGIPYPTGENGCKIVLTSRFQNVCHQMETDTEIKVKFLSQKEAWELFHEKVGDVVESSNIEPLAREVVKECGGLPLVLVVIGRSLRKVNDVHVWSNALTEYKTATFQVDANMEKTVFMQLKISFDRLNNESVKNCFLNCALYPKDFQIPIGELIEHWWVEGLIDGKLNFGEAYDKGHAILNDLINACLLEKIEDYRHRLVKVKMHDVIRDMALRITSPLGKGYGRFVVKVGVGRSNQPNEEEWEHATKMSLINCEQTFLPESERPKCALLTALLFQNSYYLREIPGSFFEHMHNLLVLNLSETGISELPWSLFNLASLRGLYLCPRLYTLPSGVGHLTRLEVLHLRSWMNYLPIEVGQLTHLRSLQVMFNIKISESHVDRIIPDGLLSRLTLLEDLQIHMNEETLRLWYGKYTKAVVEELVSLKQLISLHAPFPKVEYLVYFLQRSCHWNEGRFKSFKFFVPGGDVGSPRDRHLQLDECGDDILNDVIREVLSRSLSFKLSNNKSCKRWSDLCSMEMMNGLEDCYMYQCDAIESLIDGNGLPNLEKLHINDLPELRSIWEEPVPPQCLRWLRELWTWACPKVSNVFSRGMIHHLINLELLSVGRCAEIAEIVSEEDMDVMVGDNADMELILFPRLKTLWLYQLPKLDRFCRQLVPNHPIGWPSLQVHGIEGCPNLKNFCLNSSGVRGNRGSR